MTRPRSDPGFTLIEVLVALTVSALIVAIAMNAAVSARQRERAAAEMQAATLLARNLIEQTTSEPFTQQPRKGTEGGLDWTLTKTPEGDPLLAGRWQRVRIEVRIQNDRQTPLLSVSRTHLMAVDIAA